MTTDDAGPIDAARFTLRVVGRDSGALGIAASELKKRKQTVVSALFS